MNQKWVLKGIQGEPGTLMGPTTMGEWLVIRKSWEDEDGSSGVCLGFASPQEIQNVTLMLIEGGEPRSVAEFKVKKQMGLQ